MSFFPTSTMYTTKRIPFCSSFQFLAVPTSRLFHKAGGGSSSSFVTPSKSVRTNKSENYFTTTTVLQSTSIDAQITDTSSSLQKQPPLQINLLTIQLNELESLLKSWNQPKYRAKQILHHVHEMGVTDIDDMDSIPKKLRSILNQHASIGSLQLEIEAESKDGTRKRAYRLWDGQLIESVLMPYDDGRNTACISSQAGCAMGCVFCATGQMGFARQLTQDEIFEQVARFAAELKKDDKRLSNVVMMGMGEPLANYRNVMAAIRRMNTELGIGARKITVSTVGVVPNIKKLMEEDIQVRLALSLHSAIDEERSALLPANKRYGGLDELMKTIREYIYTTNRRVTLEWALIENENDTPEVARQLGQLLKRFDIRKDMIHINVIPLNPTGGFEGSPSGRKGVHDFVSTLEKGFGLKATPRVRRGIDIDAGCGQLKATLQKKEMKEARKSAAENKVEESIMELKSFIDQDDTSSVPQSPMVGVYEDEDDDFDESNNELSNMFSERVKRSNDLKQGSIVDFEIIDSVDLDSEYADECEDELYENDLDKDEAARLMSLVQSSFPEPETNTEDEISILSGPTTSIVNDESVMEAKKRRKKLLKFLKAINRLKDLENNGKILNDEQTAKIAKEEEWRSELESVEHNLQ